MVTAFRGSWLAITNILPAIISVDGLIFFVAGDLQWSRKIVHC